MPLFRFFSIICFACTLTLSGCKETDSDKIADAQDCLDTYARTGGGNLNDCEAYIDGITTPSAQGIRCATGFIREGFGTAQSFIDAFNAMSTVSANSVRDFLRMITFDSAGTGNSTNVNANYSNAGSVYGYCSESLAKGATIIATFSYMTNLLYKYECDNGPGSMFMGTCAMDDTALAAAIAVGTTDMTASTTAMKTDLGTVVVSTNEISCSTGTSNEQLCKFLTTAITNAGGTSDKAQVGAAFLNVLANPPN